ncbi:hypothetical protein C8R45DRAFT_923878 [Mycena sanguinolenta]|nr:hypothetical protein C8R45DRAFT_923878 [Mycena sanguinolenta]
MSDKFGAFLTKHPGQKLGVYPSPVRTKLSRFWAMLGLDLGANARNVPDRLHTTRLWERKNTRFELLGYVLSGRKLGSRDEICPDKNRPFWVGWGLAFKGINRGPIHMGDG